MPQIKLTIIPKNNLKRAKMTDELQERAKEVQEWINSKPWADPPYPNENIFNVLVRKYNKWEENHNGSKYYKKWTSDECGFAKILKMLDINLCLYEISGQKMVAIYQNRELKSKLPKGCKMVKIQQPNLDPAALFLTVSNFQTARTGSQTHISSC